VLATDIKIEIELEGNIINILKKLPEYPESSHDYLNHINRFNKIEIQLNIFIELKK